jgi:hypothetical protein
MKSFLESIKQSGAYEMFWIVTGIVLGKFIDFCQKKLQAKWKQIASQKRIDNEEIMAKEQLNIISLDHADPTYELHDIIVNNTDKKLFIDAPPDLKEMIYRFDQDFIFRNDTSFNRSNDFHDLAEITGISNLPELIEKHKRIVAKDFLSRLEQNHTIFNGEKYGVFRIHRKRTVDERENAALYIDLFKTDYFTHCVFRSIYKELKEIGASISKVEKIEDLYRYYPFTTSFGINTFVILDTSNGKHMIFAKRSKFLNKENPVSLWHVTMNEGLTETDKEGRDVSLIKCLHRGLREELGIREEHHKYIIEEHFMDLFLEMNNFEIGLTSFVTMDMSFSKLQELYSIAKDGELETDTIISIPLKGNHLKEFIKHEQLTSAALYTLKMYIARQKYFS